VNSPKKKFRCSDCCTADEFPADFTQENVDSCCEVCRTHLSHISEISYSALCPICLAREWRGWWRALRILIVKAPALRSLRGEDL
jgi:hypothetical protein